VPPIRAETIGTPLTTPR
jgi:hypothetical protein